MKTPLKLSSWFYRVVTTPLGIAAVIIFAFFIIVILPQMARQLAAISGVDISPDTSFIYTARDLYAMAEAYGPEGRDYYIYSRFTFDLIWLAAYLFFQAATITYLVRFLPEKSPWRLRLEHSTPAESREGSSQPASPTFPSASGGTCA